MAAFKSSSPNDVPAPCRCPQPDAACRRAGLPMTGRLWELCAGANCSAQQSAAYRQRWDGVPIQQSACVHRGDATGDLRPCLTCRGRVALKLFACAHPAHGPAVTLADCRRCGDYLAFREAHS